MTAKNLATHNDASRRRGGEAARKKAQHLPSDDFDWDRAIAGLHRILTEVYGKRRT